MSSSDGGAAALSSSSLKDLLKICRSHNLLLPDPLPKDKQFFVDLIVRHRQTLRGGEVYEDEAATAAAARSRREVDASAAAGHKYAQQQHTGDDLTDEGELIDMTSYANVSTRLRRAAPPPESAASAAAASLPVAAAAVPVSSVGLNAEGAPAAAAAADGEPLLAIPGVSPDPEYDDDGGEEEFIRSPAVQKITQVLQNIAAFDYLERHTGVARFYWLAMLVTLAAVALLVYVGVLAVCQFICFIYPAFQTFKTLEGKYLPLLMDETYAPGGPVPVSEHDTAQPLHAAAAPHSSRRSRRSLSFQSPISAVLSSDKSIEVHSYWLTYWCVFGLFRLVEYGSDFLVHNLSATAGAGFYYEPCKILFLVWCFHPASQGCAVMYKYVISPLFLPQEAAIDAAIARATDGASQAAQEVRAIILKKVAKRIAGGADDTPVKKDAKASSSSLHRRVESGSLKKAR